MKKRAKSGNTPVGTLRVGSKDLKVYEKTSSGWKSSDEKLPNVLRIVELFKSHDNFEELVDSKNPEFLKGQLSPKCKPQGARINVLPDGQKLNKAFSLFAPHLTIHDEKSNSHWDVIYQNPNGEFSYVYTLDKKDKAKKAKYNEVKKFEKSYLKIKRKALEKIKSNNEVLDLAIYTLLKTYMRVGNEIYYKAHGHKGLTTIQKNDVSVDEDYVEFDYKGKDGTPLSIKARFPKTHVYKLKARLNKLKKSDFVFANPATGKPLKDSEFKRWFKENLGEEFYPHIVRSYYATSKTEDFLEKNPKPKKSEVDRLFYKIAEKLGHKKFVKKDNEWEVSTKTTVNHYIDPKLIEKIDKRMVRT